MKITKILVALSFLFAVSTANAGELAVTGSIQATYQSESDSTTGKSPNAVLIETSYILPTAAFVSAEVCFSSFF